MAKPQERQRPKSNDAVREHGRAAGEAVKRLTLHTETFPLTAGTGHALDRRIIVEEANALIVRASAILSILAEGD